MVILGIDPGTTTVGWGAINKQGNTVEVLGYGVIETTPKIAQEIKLKEIYQDILELFKNFKPDLVSIEKLFFFKNPKTVISVAEAIGVIKVACKLNDIDTVQYTPLQVKSIMVGYGRATKHQIQEEVKRYLKLKEIPKPDDAADGLALSICALISEDSLLSKLSV